MTINYKLFAAGDTLSANDVLTYLENQAVIKVDAASELPTLASTYPDVKVAYAVDTDKVYVNDDGTFVALVTADGTVTLSNLTLTGNLTVQGTTTTIDSTTIAIKDKFVFEGSTADAHETTLQVVEPTADRTISLPDSSGTVALTSDIPSVASFITASSTDTLTNKTLNLGSNTVTGTLAQLNTALSDADLASLAGAETLTNKTISGASNTLSNIGNASLTNSSITMDGTPVSLGGTFTSPASYSLPSQSGNTGKFLTTNGTTDSWATVDLTGKTDKATLTTTGDIYYASGASTPARLGIGSTNQVLTVSGGIPSWATPSAPSFVGCSIYRSTGVLAINNNTSTAVPFDQEDFDTDGFHSGTNNSRITIPSGKAGYYHFIGHVNFEGSANGHRQAHLHKNGAFHRALSQHSTITTGSPHGGGSVIVYAAVGDYYELFCFQNNGTGLFLDGSIGNTKLICHYLGA